MAHVSKVVFSLMSLSAVACGLLILILDSSWPGGLAEADVIGLWVETEESHMEGQLPCTYIQFFSDGRFEGHNLPLKYFAGYDFEAYWFDWRRDISGTWYLEDSPNNLFVRPDVIMRFESIPGVPSPRGVGRAVSIPPPTRDVLWTFLEDPRATFKKKDKVDCK